MKLNKKTEYKVENDYIIEYEKLSTLKDVSQFNNAEELVILKVTKKEKKTGIYNTSEKSVLNFVLQENAIDSFLKSAGSEIEKALTEVIARKVAMEDHVLLLSKEYLSSFVSYDPNKEKDAIIVQSEDYLKDLNNDDYQLVQVLDHRYKTIYKDTSGKYYMQPLCLDYISACADNGKYLLDDLVESLAKKSNVAFEVDDKKAFRKKNILSCPLKGDEPQIQDIISSIPHYNADEERDEKVTVILYPTQEDIKTMLSNTKDSHSLESFVLEEVLGGKAFLKSPPPKEEEKEVPKRKFSRS